MKNKALINKLTWIAIVLIPVVFFGTAAILPTISEWIYSPSAPAGESMTETTAEVMTEIAAQVTTETIARVETETATGAASDSISIEPIQSPYYSIPLSCELQDLIFTMCDKYSLPYEIVLSVIYHESTYRPHLVGDSGAAYGLMQVQPKWHLARMAKYGIYSNEELFDPFANVCVGIDYLGELYRAGKGLEWTLMAYNGGPDYADALTARGVTSKYAESIIAYSVTIPYQTVAAS